MTPDDDTKPLRSDARRNRARILDAAEQVFTESGATGSTEEVARRAGVAVGTVFRHFPMKSDLLDAITKHRLARLLAELDALDHTPERGTALFAFFSRMVEQAAAKKRVADLLDQSGVEVSLPDAVQQLERAVGRLLHHAQTAGTVGDEVRLPEVMALLTSVCQGALAGGWDPGLQERTLAVVFAGLRPDGTNPSRQANVCG
jgi:AcrR family transcriptional regulator